MQLYLKNILLFPIYNLPGVFADNPYPNAVNGSLWTLPVEVFMYFLVPILLSKNDRSPKKIFCITSLVCIVEIIHKAFFADFRYVIYGSDIGQAMDIIPYYFIGIFLSKIDLKQYVSLEKSVFVMMIYACMSTSLSYALNELCLYVVFPYFVFSIAFCEKSIIGKCTIKHDISYGIYLYGFFVQQLVIGFCYQNGITNRLLCFVISIVLTVILALMSERFVEKPANKLCKYILVKMA